MNSTTIQAPNAQRGLVGSMLDVAGRTTRKFLRTPQLVALGTLQGALFLLIFRYIFGGAIDAGGVEYVHYLVPGFVIAGIIFSSMGAAIGVAEDIEQGFVDRLRSLPVPRLALPAGRAVAETALGIISLIVMTVVGFAVGFRIQGTIGAATAGLGLGVVYGFAFTWVFLSLGLIARNAQAAQGMSMLVFPLVFVSSTYVPVETMPSWLQPIAENQPVTMMVNAVRGLVLGPAAEGLLAQPVSYYVTASLVWSLALTLLFAPIAIALYRRP